MDSQSQVSRPVLADSVATSRGVGLSWPRTRNRRFVLALVVAALLAIVGIGVTPQRADAAAFGWVYVVADKSVCPASEPKALQGNFQFAGGSTTIPYDYGDAVIYPRVALGTKVTYQINVWCYVGSRQAGFRALSGTFVASYHQQSIRLFS